MELDPRAKEHDSSDEERIWNEPERVYMRAREEARAQGREQDMTDMLAASQLTREKWERGLATLEREATRPEQRPNYARSLGDGRQLRRAASTSVPKRNTTSTSASSSTGRATSYDSGWRQHETGSRAWSREREREWSDDEWQTGSWGENW